MERGRKIVEMSLKGIGSHEKCPQLLENTMDINNMEIVYAIDINCQQSELTELNSVFEVPKTNFEPSERKIKIISDIVINKVGVETSCEGPNNLNVVIEENNNSFDNSKVLHSEEVTDISPEVKLTNRWHSKADDSDYQPPSVNSSTSGSEDNIELEDKDNTTHNENVIESEINEEPGRPKKGRKRKFAGQTFKTKKRLQHGNKPYYTEKGKLMPKKFFLEGYRCCCKSNCTSLINEKTRKHIFDSFYKLANYDAQTAFICAKVREIPIKRKRNRNSEKRSFTRIYCLESVPVCKDFFINTLRVSSKRINTALCKLRKGDIKDARGEKQGGKNKISEEVITSIINHIKKFPTYKSHYCRMQTESRYLHYDITERKMYDLYKSENKEINISFSSYKSIFYKNFNLRRKPRIKDTCSLCDAYNAKEQNAVLEQDKEQLKLAHNQHLEAAEKARASLKNDFEIAKQDNKLQTLTYDMEKTLPLPSIPTNLVFYKRQLWLYNEGIHCGNKGYCFIWKEGEAGRGGQEVGSCVKKFIELFLEQNTETLIMWSDSCGGQNRNIKIVLMLKYLLSSHPTLKTVYFKYLVSGHSYLPNDSDFSDIEKAIKLNQRIYTMQYYVNIIKSCRKKNPLIVTEMCTPDFVSIANLEKEITNRKTDIEKNKISWLKAKIIKIEKEKPFSIFFKYSHDEKDQFHELHIQKNVKRQAPSTFKNKLEILWPNGTEISEKKLADIKSLMPFIPLDAKPFYKNLKGMQFEDDLDGYGINIDFEPDVTV